MDVVEIRKRVIVVDTMGADGGSYPDRDYEQKTVVHKNTTAQKVVREYYPNYKLEARNATIPKSLSSKVFEVQHYDIVPQKEKIEDPHAPRHDVDSELIEIP